MSLLNKDLNAFLSELASSSPAPGGGSVAALSGALAAALGSMVCRLTVGKKKYVDVEEDMKRLVAQTETLRARLQGLIDKDTHAFNLVMDALAMPKDTDEQKQKRTAAVESATKEATMVPLEVMETCQALVRLCGEIARKGNTSALSDAGVSALLTAAACRGAYYNVRINLSGLQDQDFCGKIGSEADATLRDVDAEAVAIRSEVEKRLG